MNWTSLDFITWMYLLSGISLRRDAERQGWRQSEHCKAFNSISSLPPDIWLWLLPNHFHISSWNSNYNTQYRIWPWQSRVIHNSKEHLYSIFSHLIYLYIWYNTHSTIHSVSHFTSSLTSVLKEYSKWQLSKTPKISFT